MLVVCSSRHNGNHIIIIHKIFYSCSFLGSIFKEICYVGCMPPSFLLLFNSTLVYERPTTTNCYFASLLVNFERSDHDTTFKSKRKMVSLFIWSLRNMSLHLSAAYLYNLKVTRITFNNRIYNFKVFPVGHFIAIQHGRNILAWL